MKISKTTKILAEYYTCHRYNSIEIQFPPIIIIWTKACSLHRSSSLISQFNSPKQGAVARLLFQHHGQSFLGIWPSLNLFLFRSRELEKRAQKKQHKAKFAGKKVKRMDIRKWVGSRNKGNAVWRQVVPVAMKIIHRGRLRFINRRSAVWPLSPPAVEEPSTTATVSPQYPPAGPGCPPVDLGTEKPAQVGLQSYPTRISFR